MAWQSGCGGSFLSCLHFFPEGPDGTVVLACRFPESLTRPQVRQLLRQAVCDYMRELARQQRERLIRLGRDEGVPSPSPLTGEPLDVKG